MNSFTLTHKKARYYLNIAVWLALALFFGFTYLLNTPALSTFKRTLERVGPPTNTELLLWCIWCGVVSLVATAVAVERPDAKRRWQWFLELPLTTTLAVGCAASISWAINAMYSPPDAETTSMLSAIFSVFLLVGVLVTVGMAGAVFLAAKVLKRHTTE